MKILRFEDDGTVDLERVLEKSGAKCVTRATIAGFPLGVCVTVDRAELHDAAKRACERTGLAYLDAREAVALSAEESALALSGMLERAKAEPRAARRAYLLTALVAFLAALLGTGATLLAWSALR